MVELSLATQRASIYYELLHLATDLKLQWLRVHFGDGPPFDSIDDVVWQYAWTYIPVLIRNVLFP